MTHTTEHCSECAHAAKCQYGSLVPRPPLIAFFIAAFFSMAAEKNAARRGLGTRLSVWQWAEMWDDKWAEMWDVDLINLSQGVPSDI